MKPVSAQSMLFPTPLSIIDIHLIGLCPAQQFSAVSKKIINDKHLHYTLLLLINYTIIANTLCQKQVSKKSCMQLSLVRLKHQSTDILLNGAMWAHVTASIHSQYCCGWDRSGSADMMYKCWCGTTWWRHCISRTRNQTHLTQLVMTWLHVK